LKPILEKFKANQEQIGRSIYEAILNRSSQSSSDTCKICHREKIDDSVFCSRHNLVYENIESGFQQWRYALGLQWVEYLEKLAKTSGTGGYVKEVIDNILG